MVLPVGFTCLHPPSAFRGVAFPLFCYFKGGWWNPFSVP